MHGNTLTAAAVVEVITSAAIDLSAIGKLEIHKSAGV